MPRTRRAFAGPFAACILAGAALGFARPMHSLAPLTWGMRAKPVAHRLYRWKGDVAFRLGDTAFGRSGQLRVAMADPLRRVNLPIEWTGAQAADLRYRWVPVNGTQPRTLQGDGWVAAGITAPAEAGDWRLQVTAPGGVTQRVEELTLVTRVPFSEKSGDGYINGYHIGRYVAEANGVRDGAYAPPPGFIEVTPFNQDMAVSTHFRLRNFLTKNQFTVWPKYLALDLRLIDKLELVMQELNAMGVRAENMAVMSGYRTPAYNIQGVGEGGRALLSRHTYGDASDVWVDNDADGYIDDLNGDGRRDTRDVIVMLRAVERVERRYPELIGGAGVYNGNGAHGPFIHIDARGYHSRWGLE
ncbi:MAG TPA: hypothetical protein VFJ16_07285 [Longimicrobium sp.]|nr:hypothetical protein [Longimicrobium sp.]